MIAKIDRRLLGVIAAMGMALATTSGAVADSVGNTRFPDDTVLAGIAAGPDGNVWVVGNNNVQSVAFVGRITPSGSHTEFADDRTPVGITLGPDRNLWFANNGYIGRITPQGAITHFALPGAPPAASITTGADGNLWFFYGGTDSGLGRITPQGVITEFPAAHPLRAALGYDAGLQSITSGPDRNLWATVVSADQTASAVAKFSTSGQLLATIPVRGEVPSNVQSITAGPDGNIWFTEDQGIGRISPSTSQYRKFSFGAKGISPGGITTGPDRNLWFAYSGLGRITPSGAITLIPVRTPPGTHPIDIVTGPDKQLWYTVSTDNFNHGGGVQSLSAPSTPCLVPNLLGATLAQTRLLVHRAHCQLGRIIVPHRRRCSGRPGLRVAAQQPRPRSRQPGLTPVNVNFRCAGWSR